MAYLFNGATHVINRADAVVQTWPLTMHGRIRLTSGNDGLSHCILGLFEASSTNGFRLEVVNSAGNMIARSVSRAGGSAATANGTTFANDSNWHSVVGEVTAANARQVWLDNGGNASNSTSLTPSTLTKTSIGAYNNGGTISGNIAHELADVAVWSGTLTADERAALANGVSPALIRPDILELYLPLVRGGNDYMGGAFTVTAATVADHPRVYMPARAFVVKTAASTGVTGTASITEAGDTVAAASTLAIAAALALTEASDTVSSAATLALAASGSITEAGDTVASAATLALAGTAAITEAGDTSSATGTLAIVANASITEAGDTLSATGVGVVTSTGAAVITEADDTAASVATLKIAGAAGISEAGDTSAATATLAIKATLAANDNNDTLSATATSGSVAVASRSTGSRPSDGTSTLRLNLSGGSRPSAISRGAR